jgi:hypothetical protein
LFKVQEVGVYEPSCNDKDLHGHLCARFSSTWHKMRFLISFVSGVEAMGSKTNF